MLPRAMTLLVEGGGNGLAYEIKGVGGDSHMEGVGGTCI